jgi:hypothetical protein
MTSHSSHSEESSKSEPSTPRTPPSIAKRVPQAFRRFSRAAVASQKTHEISKEEKDAVAKLLCADDEEYKIDIPKWPSPNITLDNLSTEQVAYGIHHNIVARLWAIDTTSFNHFFKLDNDIVIYLGQLTDLFAWHVIRQPDEEHRVSAVRQVLQIAWILIRLSNDTGAKAVLDVLNINAVNRLVDKKNINELIDEKEAKLIKEFSSASKNSVAYRDCYDLDASTKKIPSFSDISVELTKAYSIKQGAQKLLKEVAVTISNPTEYCSNTNQRNDVQAKLGQANEMLEISLNSMARVWFSLMSSKENNQDVKINPEDESFRFFFHLPSVCRNKKLQENILNELSDWRQEPNLKFREEVIPDDNLASWDASSLVAFLRSFDESPDAFFENHLFSGSHIMSFLDGMKANQAQIFLSNLGIAEKVVDELLLRVYSETKEEIEPKSPSEHGEKVRRRQSSHRGKKEDGRTRSTKHVRKRSASASSLLTFSLK